MFSAFTSPRRVAITGFGCVTPIGIGREAYWESLKSGRSGVRRIESFDTSDATVKIAAEIPEARLAVIDDARHLVNVERPAEVNEALVAFL